MHTLPEVIRRQFRPLLLMLRQSINACPDDAFTGKDIGPREHIYHALVGMDVWLAADPTQYAFDQIVDSAAAELEGLASNRVSREFLIEFLDRVEGKVADLPAHGEGFLTVHALRGKECTLLDRCLGQLRHVQHHIGAVGEIFRSQRQTPVDWSGYGE